MLLPGKSPHVRHSLLRVCPENSAQASLAQLQMESPQSEDALKSPGVDLQGFRYFQ